MYIIDNFVFGHELALNKKINNALVDFDAEFSTLVNKKRFVVEFPYHGGQVAGNTYSVIFGAPITDDDGNKDFIKEVRNAKEEDYADDYNKFIEEYIVALNENLGQDAEYDAFIGELIDYLKNTKPGFYSVESSS